MQRDMHTRRDRPDRMSAFAAAVGQVSGVENSVSIEPGLLYVVATPIGNLDDMSPRAVRVLQQVNWIAAENTIYSKRLLQRFGVDTPIVSYHDFNEDTRIPRIILDLQAGKSIALISDAGTPLISDPGFSLLRALSERNLRAVPIPGPSSVLAALSVSGLPTDRFAFEGFLPAKSAARRGRLASLRDDDRTLIFMEACHRIHASLFDMADLFGAQRSAVVARELTKIYEEVRADTLSELCGWVAKMAPPKGEFVVLVHGAAREAGKSIQHDQEVRRLLGVLLEELPAARAVAVAVKLTNYKRNYLYGMAMAMKNGRESS